MYSDNVLILTYWPVKDALIQTYVLPYVKIIRRYLSHNKTIWLQTLEKNENSQEAAQSTVTTLLDSKINWVPCRYSNFGLSALLVGITNLVKLIILCRSKKIGIIHVWCSAPGVTGYILSVMTGAKLVLDSYEPHAEAMVENGSWNRYGIKFRLLFLFEKLMYRRAKVIVLGTLGMKDYARLKHGTSMAEFHVKPACVDLELFSLSNVKNEYLMRKLDLVDKIVMLYAGKLGDTYLDQEIFDLTKIAHQFYSGRFRLLLLTAHKREEIDEFCRRIDLSPKVVISQYVSHAEIPVYMGMADFAITPVKPVPTKRYCTPIKDGEYWALGLPILITKGISDDSGIIERENIGAVLETLDEEGYISALQKIDSLLQSDRNQLRTKIRAVANNYRSFDLANHVYSQIYC